MADAQQLGFSLKEIRELLTLRVDGQNSCGITGLFRKVGTWELLHQLLMLDGTQVVQGRMPTNPVVQALHELENALLGLVSALNARSLNTFAFQRREEALHDRVLITVTLTRF